MKQTLISILEGLATPAYKVILQGSLAPTASYPDSFFTYWNTETPGASHYDNNPHAFVWSFTVSFYSISPTLVNTVIEQAISALRAAGWTVDGKGYDTPSDEPTHTGRAFEAMYIETDNNTTEE